MKKIAIGLIVLISVFTYAKCGYGYWDKFKGNEIDFKIIKLEVDPNDKVRIHYQLKNVSGRYIKALMFTVLYYDTKNEVVGFINASQEGIASGGSSFDWYPTGMKSSEWKSRVKNVGFQIDKIKFE
jgi:hypothetical protein